MSNKKAYDMHKNLYKIIFTVILVCSTITAAWADGWKLTGTTIYGAGGYWENGQKIRIDCSYKKGQFQYERKVTINNKMLVYSTKAVFAEPQQSYTASENISVSIAFTEKGEKQGYAPYARVTVMPQNPNWIQGKGASNKIPASGAVDGQATDVSGRSIVVPSETTTLTAKVPSSGSQMAIVYSCNGMDVVYLYDWDGVVIAQDKEAVQEIAFEEQVKEEDNDVETYEEEEETYGEEQMEVGDHESKPLIKLIIIGVVALLLIVLIIFVFKKKNNGNKAIDNETGTGAEMGTEQGKGMICPNCGEPIEIGEKFCQNCGCKLLSFAILVVAALLTSCGSTESISANDHTGVTVHKQETVLLKNTNTKGVKLFTFFDIDSKSLTQEEINQLDALAREIKAMGNAQVSVIGHSDNIGSSDVNEVVSVRRARLVGDYLKNKGVTNITTSGESYNHSVAGNDTAAGRAKNRRVEVFVSTIGKYNPYK